MIEAPLPQCDLCGLARVPAAQVGPARRKPLTVCISCLAGKIDEATGWKMRRQVEQNVLNTIQARMVTTSHPDESGSYLRRSEVAGDE